MNKGKEKLKELYGDNHPGFSSYMECITRTYVAGFATFTVGFSLSYITQNLLKDKLPYSSKSFILTSSLVGALLSYTVVKSKSKNCQLAWLAAEDKVTYLTELNNLSSPS